MANWQTFPFGKYQCKNFNSVHDLQYLQWFIGQLNNECQIENCAKAIIQEINRRRKNRCKHEQ